MLKSELMAIVAQIEVNFTNETHFHSCKTYIVKLKL